jgi:hypothetical protein
LGLAGPAAAADLFNNLGDPILGYETTSNGGSGPAGYPAYLAEAFYTGPSAFQLSDVALKLVSGGGGDPATTVTISLVADMPNIPSPGDPSPDFPGSTIADLGTLADPAVAAVPTVYTLAANQILAPNSIYWIKLESNVPFTETFWAYATVGSQLYYDGLSTGYPINFASPFEMRVSGSVVPEPASWGLTILGLAGVGSALRGRKRTVSA